MLFPEGRFIEYGTADCSCDNRAATENAYFPLIKIISHGKHCSGIISNGHEEHPQTPIEMLGISRLSNGPSFPPLDAWFALGKMGTSPTYGFFFIESPYQSTFAQIVSQSDYDEILKLSKQKFTMVRFFSGECQTEKLTIRALVTQKNGKLNKNYNQWFTKPKIYQSFKCRSRIH